MAFDIGINVRNIDENIIRGIQKEIACECWCTSKGKITPLMIKLKDEDGEIQTIKNILVHTQENKRYAGIPFIEYNCTFEYNGKNIKAKLIFYQIECRWALSIS